MIARGSGALVEYQRFSSTFIYNGSIRTHTKGGGEFGREGDPSSRQGQDGALDRRESDSRAARLGVRHEHKDRVCIRRGLLPGQFSPILRCPTPDEKKKKKKCSQASRASLMPKSKACERTALMIWACIPCKKIEVAERKQSVVRQFLSLPFFRTCAKFDG